LGGGFVPVESLPEWVQPVAPVSPVYWAMEGYGSATLSEGGVLVPAAVLLAFAIVFAALAVWRFRVDAPKRTWG
jgi:ABC-2 type transport system permease protein